MSGLPSPNSRRRRDVSEMIKLYLYRKVAGLREKLVVLCVAEREVIAIGKEKIIR